MLVGRTPELTRIAALLEDARRGRSGVLVLVGDPGIGKTALLQTACEASGGLRVLALGAFESESELPFAGLDRLLRASADGLSALPAHQREALAAATGSVPANALDPFSVDVATLAHLASVAEAQPLLLALDDVQWLDRATADALAFSARRLAGEGIAVLATVRSGEASVFLDGFEPLVLRPLDDASSRSLVRAVRPTVDDVGVDAIVEAALGNPLALLELRVGPPGGSHDALDERLRRAYLAQLEVLSAAAQRGLLLTAAEPVVRVVRGAAAILEVADALQEIEQHGLVSLAGEDVVFRHPLVRSIVYATARPEERAAAHAALAEALTSEQDADRRVWHLAASSAWPDDEVANGLAQTADRALQRGGHAARARALERAAALSSDAGVQAVRLSEASRSALWAGEPAQARQMGQRAFELTDDPRVRADVLHQLATIDMWQGSRSPDDLLLETLDAVEELDVERASRLLQELVRRRVAAWEVEGALVLAPRLEAAARRSGDWWGPRGLATASTAHLLAGDVARSSALLDEISRVPEVAANTALYLLHAERYEVARDALRRTMPEVATSGRPIRAVWNSMCLAHLELTLGSLEAAARAASTTIELGRAMHADSLASVGEAALAGVRAWQGDDTGCRELAAGPIAMAIAQHEVDFESTARWPLGILALGRGAPEDAVAALDAIGRRWLESEVQEPSSVPFVPELVEALHQVGRTADARRLLTRFQAAASATDRRWALAASWRCAGLLEDDFEPCFARALEVLDGSPLLLQRARAHLAFGERLRRAHRRREARAQLRAASDLFAKTGADVWQTRAETELRATGETVQRRTPERRVELTPQELQIACLAAEGKSNKDIAAVVYLSPKTVDYHLAKAYRKLDVHSRAELATRIARSGLTPPS